MITTAKELDAQFDMVFIGDAGTPQRFWTWKLILIGTIKDEDAEWIVSNTEPSEFKYDTLENILEIANKILKDNDTQ